jgi:serine/threonine-protein kinase RsbT
VAGEIRVEIASDTDVVVARQEARALARGLGFSPTDTTLLATAISEVARNIVSYAGAGELAFREVVREGARGIEVVASDEGPGIVDVDRALEDGYSTGQGLGLGLPGARRLVHEFTVWSQVGEGTTVTLRMWTQQV